MKEASLSFLFDGLGGKNVCGFGEGWDNPKACREASFQERVKGQLLLTARSHGIQQVSGGDCSRTNRV